MPKARAPSSRPGFQLWPSLLPAGPLSPGSLPIPTLPAVLRGTSVAPVATTTQALNPNCSQNTSSQLGISLNARCWRRHYRLPGPVPDTCPFHFLILHMPPVYGSKTQVSGQTLPLSTLLGPQILF